MRAAHSKDPLLLLLIPLCSYLLSCFSQPVSSRRRRSTLQEDQEERRREVRASEWRRRGRRWRRRREEAAHGLLRGAAGQAEERVRGESLPDGGAPAQPGRDAGAEREPDQDLVPEQACQAEEEQRAEGGAGADAGGAGTLQPLHHTRGRGRQSHLLRKCLRRHFFNFLLSSSSST